MVAYLTRRRRAGKLLQHASPCSPRARVNDKSLRRRPFDDRKVPHALPAQPRTARTPDTSPAQRFSPLHHLARFIHVLYRATTSDRAQTFFASLVAGTFAGWRWPWRHGGARRTRGVATAWLCAPVRAPDARLSFCALRLDQLLARPDRSGCSARAHRRRCAPAAAIASLVSVHASPAAVRDRAAACGRGTGRRREAGRAAEFLTF